MSEWRKFRLEDFIGIHNQTRIPLSKMERSKKQGIYPYYGASGVIDCVDDYLFDGKFVLVSEDGENLKSRKTPIAFKVCGKFWVNNHAHIIQGKKEFHNDLIVYYFQNLDLHEYITGAVQPKLNKANLLSIPLFLPEKETEQKAITEVLRSLDDKIGLLHRQNETLEQMAETLFRQWFVEKAEEDWVEKPLSNIASFLNGLACQKFPPKNEVDKLPVLKIKQLRNGFSDDSDWCTTEVKPEYIIKNGDVIFSWSASLMVKIWDGEKCILNQHLFKVSSNEFPKWFYYLWSKHHLDEFISISSSHATTMGHIKRGDLDNAVVLVPSPDEVIEFSTLFTPLIDNIISNNKKLKTLEALRNTLLPKLMNGEVRVVRHG